MKNTNLINAILNAIASGVDGQTFDSQGNVLDVGNNDIVTVTCINVDGLWGSAEADDFIEKYTSFIEEAPQTCVGVFRLHTKEGHKKDLYSVDINVLVDPKHRANTLEFAQKNGQISIWSGSEQKAIPTNGSGEARLANPAMMILAAQRVISGRPFWKPVEVFEMMVEDHEHQVVTMSWGGEEDNSQRVTVPIKLSRSGKPQDILPAILQILADYEKTEEYEAQILSSQKDVNYEWADLEVYLRSEDGETAFAFNIHLSKEGIYEAQNTPKDSSAGETKVAYVPTVQVNPIDVAKVAVIIEQERGLEIEKGFGKGSKIDPRELIAQWSLRFVQKYQLILDWSDFPHMDWAKEKGISNWGDAIADFADQKLSKM